MLLLLICVFIAPFSTSSKEFTCFSQAKRYLKKHIKADAKTLYCGCDIAKQGKKLIPETEACGYEPRNEFTKKGKVNQRATRHGTCDVKIDFKQRVIQPPKSAKKHIADTYFLYAEDLWAKNIK